LGNRNDSKDKCEVEKEFKVELDCGIKDLQSLEQRDMYAAINLSGLI